MSAPIIFTSGATEANNLVLQGIVKHLKRLGKTHIISSEIEHKSVKSTLEALMKDHGFTVTFLKHQPCGILEVSSIEKAMTDQTGLISIHMLNNEIGVIQPIEEICKIAKTRGIYMHTDAAQALGKIEIDVEKIGIDFMSLSAHKIHGPQGIGALYTRHAFLDPILYGGGQEQGLRAGTLPVALCAGFGKACELIDCSEIKKLQGFREHILERVSSRYPNIVIHGRTVNEWQYPGIISLRFPGIDNETLIMGLDRVSISAGSACGNVHNEPSHVIASLVSEQAAFETIRISMGRYTSQDDVDALCENIISTVDEIYHMQKKEVA